MLSGLITQGPPKISIQQSLGEGTINIAVSTRYGKPIGTITIGHLEPYFLNQGRDIMFWGQVIRSNKRIKKIFKSKRPTIFCPHYKPDQSSRILLRARAA